MIERHTYLSNGYQVEGGLIDINRWPIVEQLRSAETKSTIPMHNDVVSSDFTQSTQ